jgi:hypothetical protein
MSEKEILRRRRWRLDSAHGSSGMSWIKEFVMHMLNRDDLTGINEEEVLRMCQGNVMDNTATTNERLKEPDDFHSYNRPDAPPAMQNTI